MRRGHSTSPHGYVLSMQEDAASGARGNAGVAELARKLEHCQLDINALRDTLLAQALESGTDQSGHGSHYAQITSSSWCSATRSIAQLYADLEGMRILVRRIEVHQSVEVNVFSQIREMQRFLRGLQKLIDVRAPADSIVNLSGRLDTSVLDLAQRVDEARRTALEQVVAAREEILATIAPIARDEARQNFEENAAKFDFVDKRVYDLGVKGVYQQVDLIKDKLTQLFVQVNKRGMKQANEYIKTFIVERMFGRHKDLFHRWVRFTASLREQEVKAKTDVLDSVCWHLGRVNARVSLRSAFFDWIAVSERQRSWEEFEARLVQIVTFWMERAAPSLAIKKWFRRWRYKAVVLREAETEEKGGAALVPLVQLATKKIKDLPPDDNASFANQVGVFNEVLGRVVQTLGGWENTLIKLKKDQVNMVKSLQLSEQTQKTLLDTQVGTVAANLSKASVTLSNQLGALAVKIDEMRTKLGGDFAQVDKRALRAEDRLDKLEAGMRQQEHAHERVLMLQADMLERIEKLEMFQKHAITKFDNALRESAEAKKRSQKADDSNVSLKSTLQDAMIFFDSEVKSLWTQTRAATSQIKDMDEMQQQFGKILSSTTDNLVRRADFLEKQARDFLPLPPHPSDLVEICLEYEAHCVQQHCMGQFALVFPPDVMLKLAEFCKKFCEWVDEEISVLVFCNVLEGGGGKRTTRRRRELVEEFIDNFAVLLREAESKAAPGAVRANARVMFYRKFLRTCGGVGQDSSGVVAPVAEVRRRDRSPQHQHQQRPKSAAAAFSTSASSPSKKFTPPPWRGGEDFKPVQLEAEDEEKEKEPPPAFPFTRGVLRKALPKVARLGGGFKLPKEQASREVVDELVQSFQRSVSIPLLHPIDAGVDMQSRRLATVGDEEEEEK